MKVNKSNQFKLKTRSIIKTLKKHKDLPNETINFLIQNEKEYLALLKENIFLKKNINLDPKTKLLAYNPNYLTEIIKNISRFSTHTQGIIYPITFIRFDIDNFSKINNVYGHKFGDQVLISVAKLLKKNSRLTDYLIKFGGDEFDVILPGNNLKQSRIYLEKIFSKIKSIDLKVKEKKIAKVTVSAGVSGREYQIKPSQRICSRQIKRDFEELQVEADQALYESKYLGKESLSFYSSEKKKEYSKIRKLYQK